MGVQVRHAKAIREVAAVRRLWHEYWEEMGFTPCFQGFEQEVASLPGRYTLLLALWNGEPAGTVAWRKWDATRVEAKRLYVRKRFRGKGVARALMAEMIAELRAAGCKAVLGDTIPGAMNDALRLYELLGFERISPYYDGMPPEAVALELKL
ncbi:MAG: GNAT family N-acetyltransferase [Bryobacterales bacterium]|nr:GNAT family N-acetyltransferase [Bryobacterales bacterium]